MARSRRIRTALYGDQAIENTELDLLHTPALQRLYDLNQLGLSDRVFIDATHSRLQHVLGVLQQVDDILTAISENLEESDRKPLGFRSVDGKTDFIAPLELANYIRSRGRAVRLMGLLHDLTHAPFGHTLEDEIELEPTKHDNPSRQAEAFYRLLCQYIGWVAQEYPSKILSIEKAPPLKGDAADHDITLLRLMVTPVLAKPSPSDSEKEEEFVEYSDDFTEFMANIAAEVIRDTPDSRRLQRAPSGREILDLLINLRFAMRGLLWLDALHHDRISGLFNDNPVDGNAGNTSLVKKDGAYAFERLIDRTLTKVRELAIYRDPFVEEFHLPKDALFLDVIGNTICADLLDYAKRDSHYAGLKLDYDVDRIVENFTVVSFRRPLKDKTRRRPKIPMLRTAITIFTHKLRVDAPGELMNLLQVRFYVYQRVLFHPTKSIAGAMLGSAMQLMGWGRIPSHHRFMGDAVFLDHVADVGRMLLELIADTRGRRSGERMLSEIREPLEKRLQSFPEIAVVKAARNLIEDRRDHSIDVVSQDIEAALALLARLAARRYHRSIFRQLPNAEVPQLNMAASDIAPVFLDPRTRARAERAIERLGELPKGTVTIHCPSADGPRKIAEILILSEKDGKERVFPLRELARIDQEIFQKHQDAITAVEDMYASMWRLTVSVAPPHHEKFVELNPHIGRVLYTTLAGEDLDDLHGNEQSEEVSAEASDNTVPNDPRMDLELRGLLAPEDSDLPKVRLVYGDGRRVERSERYVNVGDIAVGELGKDDRIAGYITGRYAANEPSEADIEQRVRSLIRTNEHVESPEQPDLLDGS